MNVTYPKLGELLNKTGRQILYTCSWPVYGALSSACNGDLSTEACFPGDQVAKSCSTWRVFKDIMDVYNLPGHAGVRQIIDFYAHNNRTLRKVNGPGSFNDYDMLLAGDAGLSVGEAQIQMGMWSMWSAPLLMSNDLRTIEQEFVDVLQNEEVSVVSDRLWLRFCVATPVYLCRHLKPRLLRRPHAGHRCRPRRAVGVGRGYYSGE